MNHTTYDEIYDRFLDKIHDYSINTQLENNIVFANSLLLGYLRSAIPRFTYCVKDLSKRNDTLLQFNICLSEREKEILSLLMVVEHLRPKILRDEYLVNRLGSKDYQEFSPSNQLKVLNDLQERLKDDANTLMLEYYYRESIK